MHWHVNAIRHDRSTTQRLGTFWNLDDAKLLEDGLSGMLQNSPRVCGLVVEECESLECIVDGLGA